jgi:hypothetical protein
MIWKHVEKDMREKRRMRKNIKDLESKEIIKVLIIYEKRMIKDDIVKKGCR